MNIDYKQKLINFHQSYKRMPTYTEMMNLFGFKSKNAVARIVQKMVIAGIVTKDKLGKIIPTDMFNSTPLLGSVKAGFPATAEEISDNLNIEDYLIQKKESTYLLEVDGDSMIDAHIEEGDIVIAERTSNAKDGDIVIACVDGEFTMKYFRKNGPKIWLEPANKKYAPIYPENSLTIEAIVKGIIRKY